MFTSTAIVPTDAAARYAKQLLSHIGRKAGVEPVEGDPEAGLLRLSAGIEDTDDLLEDFAQALAKVPA